MWYFLFFFVSGFCGVLYELIWLRLAMAQFGITTPLVSIVLSMFMAGLRVGSIGTGTWVQRFGGRISFPPLLLYALAELLIGISAFLVPAELALGHRLQQAIAEHFQLSSALSYIVSGGWLALTVVPWCACMGATIPLAMFAIRSEAAGDARRSFSFLYLANVLGAIAGAVVPLFLIELFGFHATLRVGAALNACIATSAVVVALLSRTRTTKPALQTTATEIPARYSGLVPSHSRDSGRPAYQRILPFAQAADLGFFGKGNLRNHLAPRSAWAGGTRKNLWRADAAVPSQLECS
jgi:spermidine synthase